MATVIKVLGERELSAEIKALRKRLGMSMGEFADESARSVRDAVVRNAQPFGVGKKAMEKGKRAIVRDLLKCFRIVPDGSRRGRGMVSSLSEAERFHKSRRNSRGRVSRGDVRPILASVFRVYLARVQERVGRAKGSVAGGGDPRLQGRVPSWVKEHDDEGKAKRRRKVSGAEWKFSAHADHVASDRVLGRRGLKRVFRVREKVLLKRLERKEKAELRKAQRRVNKGGS